LSNIPVLTLYATIHTTIVAPETRFLVARYRIVSEYVTRLDVDYYDDLGSYVTRISYPTRYFKSVNTVFIGTETRMTPPIGVPSTPGTEATTPPHTATIPTHTPRRGGSKPQHEVLPVTF
jgi:hypothetical protein